MAKSTQNIKNNIRWEINGLLLISFGVLGFFRYIQMPWGRWEGL